MYRKILFLIVLLAMGTLPAWQTALAQSQSEGSFTFKRVKPPAPGQGKRITVQIAPPPLTATPAAVPAGSAPVAELGRYSWFWEKVSPDQASATPGRLSSALIALSNPPAGEGVNAPRLDQLLGIAREQGRVMLLETVDTRVSPALVLAVVAVESAGRANAVSSAGAEGLMQLIPATAERFGVSDSLDAGQNIAGGVAYLDWLLREFQDDPILALAAYNAGENAVKTHGGVPPFAETRDYVPKVLAAFAVAKNLCLTPPELISDGCVFNLGS